MQKIILLTVKLIFLGALLVGLLTPVQTTNAGISPSARLSSTARHIPAAQMSPSATAVWLDGTTLYYRADSGQQNQVTTSLSGADLQVYDAGAALTPGAGCTAVDANTVSCPAAGVTLLYLDLGDQSDSAILTTHLNSVITGGDGLFYSDVLTVTGTTANDTFIISGTQVTRSGGETVTFNGIESLGVDGLGGEYVDMDSYTVNFGSLPLLVNIGDSGSSLISLDSLTLYGTPAADTFLAASGQIGLVTFPPQIVSQHDVEVIQVYGGAGDDTFDCGLASWPLLLYGQAGNDELTGSLLGGSLDGGEGDDILHASAGPELLTGGTGDDDYIFSDGWGLDSISESNDAGVDTLDFTAVTTDTTVTISPLSVADAGSDPGCRGQRGISAVRQWR